MQVNLILKLEREYKIDAEELFNCYLEGSFFDLIQQLEMELGKEYMLINNVSVESISTLEGKIIYEE